MCFGFACVVQGRAMFKFAQDIQNQKIRKIENPKKIALDFLLILITLSSGCGAPSNRLTTYNSCTLIYPLHPTTAPVPPPTRSIHPWVLHCPYPLHPPVGPALSLPTPSTRGFTPHLYYSPCRSRVWRSTCRTSCRRRASPWVCWMSHPSAGSCTYTSCRAWGLHPQAAGCKYTTVDPHV